MEEALCVTWRGRPLRSTAGGASLPARDGGGGREQDSVPSRAVPLRGGSHRRLSEAIPSDHDCALLRASPARQARHGPTARESVAPPAQRALAALREAPAWAPTAGGREVPRAHPRHTQASVSVHGDRRLHAHPRAQDLRRVQPAHRDPLYRRRAAALAISGAGRADRQRGEFQSQFHWHLESQDVTHVYIRPARRA
jgi:hypothetical protein